ncbi:cysteine-tryptophan domain-containing zinc finger protein 7 [Malania oleifera]|uniref:cysteine-tryptophan domain-containing zinc finger protein 7 n=1 Tax=Malania oleifera TaxID=397392 RepID=UPI0025AE38FE|nr:cysteine-tryptophan domain-containing zinc finger protein 7 [Malania oleifera]
MISVGTRDGRKGLGLGLGFDVRRKMEETELEEGEACSFQDDDPSIDPDIDFSYLDEKIQDVLGHFQKDFEGGVSAENLGAKFGGYGSFLPTHQRSPIWSHQRSPPRAQNCTPSSPNNLQLEGNRLHSVVPSSAPQPRLEHALTVGESLPAVKVPFVTESAKQDVSVPSARCAAEEFPPRYELANKSANVPDQKTLKVRIKVGSDNLSTRKNAEIYSGLGLDVSPSSSLEESQTESEGLSREPQDASDESPTSILQTMTSFPVHGGLLLSPLSDDLLCLTNRAKLLRDIRSGPVSKGSQDIPVMMGNGSLSSRGDGKVLRDKKTKSWEKNSFSVALENGNDKDARSTCKKEVDIDASACEGLVSNTLKLPLFANPCGSAGGVEKSCGRAFDIPREANKGVVKDKSFSDLAKEESLEPTPSHDVGWVEMPIGKVSSAGKVSEDKRTNSLNDASVCRRKDGDRKADKTYDSVKTDSNASKGSKAQNAELLDPLKEKATQKVVSHEQNSLKGPIGKDLSSSGGKKKSKGNQNHGNSAADLPKETLRVDSSSLPKNKRSTYADNYMPKNELEDLKMQKDFGKASDRYRDFFGDMKLEEEENGTDSLEMPSDDLLKDAKVVEKCTTVSSSGSKYRLSSKKIDKPSNPEECPKVVSNAAPPSENGPCSDPRPAMVAPAVILESWVCCDKCQKWRLLPVGTNPDNLPEKWLCSMLNWLPGMNKCSISEEETTKALFALYQLPAPESQNNLHGHAGGVVSAASLADVRNLDQNYQNHFRAEPSSLKKKHGLKEMSNATNQDGPMKKNLQASVKSRSLNDVNQSPLVNEPDFQHFSKSGDPPMEKHKYKQKEKHKLLEHKSDGGDSKKLKMKSRREIDQDCSRASKKIKKEGMRGTDEDWMSDHVGAIEKLGPSSNSVFPTNAAGKDRPKYKDRSSSRDSKIDSKGSLQVSVRKTKNEGQVAMDGTSIDKGKHDNRDGAKKRKVKESLDNEICSGSLTGTEHHLRDSGGFVKEEFSESDQRKEKKTKLLNFGGIESSANKAAARADNKGEQMGQDLGITLSQRSLDGLDSLKRDLGALQPSVAATSSSSKVSGSHKTRANFQEVKGSPVESVSSSPLRILNPDKSAPARRDLLRKDDSRDTGFLVNGSPRRCSDGEDDGRSDRSGTARKDKTTNATHRRSLESSVLDFTDGDFSHLPSCKVKPQVLYSPEYANHNLTNGVVDTSGRDTQYFNEPQALDRFHNEERKNENYHHANGSRPRKSGKGPSSWSRDNNRSSKSEFDNGKMKITSSLNESQEHALSYLEKSREGKHKFQEKSGYKSDKIESNFVGKKDKLSSESSKREKQLKFGGQDGPDIKSSAISGQIAISTPYQSQQEDCDGERSSTRLHSDKTDRTEIIPARGKSSTLPPSRGCPNETLARCPQPASVSQKGTGPDMLSVDASEGDDALQVAKHTRKLDNQNGAQNLSSRQSTPSGHRVRDADARSPVRRDSSSQAALTALKDAKNLKHMADRLKNSGSNLESTGLYFEAAMKFLHAASLFESSNSDGGKHGEMIQSMQVYSSTAKLCEFCAREYERFKDMAAAALAYKCMEVAYMRVIYSSHSSASRDQNELQMALQMVPPGESPSSSASDVDNLNNPPTLDKVALNKGVSSPQVAGNHVIAARNRPNFVRLLNFVHDVNFAMEASRKSRFAFAAANVGLEDVQYKEGIASIKRALDFNFQDVEGLLRLVRLAMEAIGGG